MFRSNLGRIEDFLEPYPQLQNGAYPWKRKRQGAEAAHNRREGLERSSESRDDDVRDVFRRHFEAQFEPLQMVRQAASIIKEVPIDNDDDGEQSEWDGISEPEGCEPIEIVEHTETQTISMMSKDELKAFMSAKPPIDTVIILPVSKLPTSTTKEDLDESANLKKDLALQRLLAESHLLDSPNNSSMSGVNRHKATDLRIQSLGAKTSILRQETMPMSHRIGIISKQGEREEKRRREARENGIVLEKAKSGMKGQKGSRRDRGIGGPGIGKFSGGTLRLSRKDISDIEGPKARFTSKGEKGRDVEAGLAGALDEDSHRSS